MIERAYNETRESLFNKSNAHENVKRIPREMWAKRGPNRGNDKQQIWNVYIMKYGIYFCPNSSIEWITKLLRSYI